VLSPQLVWQGTFVTTGLLLYLTISLFLQEQVVRAEWDDAIMAVTNHPLAFTSSLSNPKLAGR